ncbi:MAG: leucine-rich repeat protein [Saccharofermentanales bacterium]|jgi:uncharacterized protein YgiM (DUF1202 family)
MKKKTYLRIRALILVILLILTTLIISPEQALADTQVAADEETSQVIAEEESTQTTVNEEVTETISNSEDQNDSEQPVNEIETDTDTDTGTDIDTDIIAESQEKTSESATDTDTDTTEITSEPILESSEQTLEQVDETDEQVDGTDTSSGVDEEVEMPKAEQPTEEAVTDKPDEQDADVTVPDSAQQGRGARIVYTPDDDFEFDPDTGTITRYIGSDTDVNIPPYINSVKVENIGLAAFEMHNLTSVTLPDGILTIGHCAFNACGLDNITIPNSVISIHSSAFTQNNLTSIVIPNSVQSIGEEAFWFNDIVLASVPGHIFSIENNEGELLVLLPTIEEVGEHCFDEGVYLRGKRYIKANYNIRKSPDGEVITKLWRPLYVAASSKVGGKWVDFDYNQEQVYVAIAASTNRPQPISGYAKGTLNIRDEPDGSIIGTIPRGYNVQGELVGNMVETTYNGTTGYVYASLLQKDPVQVTRYVKAGSNIRSAPGGTIIETLKIPILVTGTITGSYLRFTYKGQTAYVAMSLTTTQNPPITGYAKSAVNVRNAPGGSIIGTLPVGRQVKGVLVGNMVRFTYNSQTGYVYVSMLQATPVRVTRYVVANSIIRSAPGGSIIARPWRPLLVSGTIQGAWLKFTYNGRTAYVAMSLTTTQNPPITGYTKSTVNVRSTPNGSVIGSLPANRKVSGVLVGNWVKFTYAGRTGYISASLLKK